MTAATGTRIDPSLSHLTTYTGDSLRCLAMPMGGLVTTVTTVTIAAGEELVVIAR